MVLIRNKNLSPGLQANTYKTTKGNEYLFELALPTRVDDPDDIKYFLHQDDVYEEVKPLKEKAKKTIEKLKDTFTSEKKQKEKEKADYESEYKVLKDLTKKEQSKLIRDLAGHNSMIPQYEDKRIKMIMRLRKDNKGGN